MKKAILIPLLLTFSLGLTGCPKSSTIALTGLAGVLEGIVENRDRKREEEQRRAVIESQRAQAQYVRERARLEREYLQLEKERLELDKMRLEQQAARQEKSVAEKPKVSVGSSGTGFAITENVVATNYHIVAEAGAISITVDNTTYRGRLLTGDPVNDIALVKVSLPADKLLEAIPIGTVSSVDAGDPVYAAGYPLSDILGKELRISEGIVNSTRGLSDDPRMFQISIPVQPGNSGSPLFDSKGNVIGIVTQTLNNKYLLVQAGFLAQNVNFAVKVNYMLSLVEQYPELANGLLRIKNSNKMTASEIARKYMRAIVLVTATPAHLSPKSRGNQQYPPQDSKRGIEENVQRGKEQTW